MRKKVLVGSTVDEGSVTESCAENKNDISNSRTERTSRNKKSVVRK